MAVGTRAATSSDAVRKLRRGRAPAPAAARSDNPSRRAAAASSAPQPTSTAVPYTIHHLGARQNGRGWSPARSSNATPDWATSENPGRATSASNGNSGPSASTLPVTGDSPQNPLPPNALPPCPFTPHWYPRQANLAATKPPMPETQLRASTLDGQVHHDTRALPMGNYVIAVGNHVIVIGCSELGNYLSADTHRVPTRSPGPEVSCHGRSWCGGLSPMDGAMAGERVLECRGLRRSFGKIVAVDGVGFHIDPGETYGLLGPNGAGKTTTISIIAGLLECDAGEVVVAGEPMTTHSVRAKSALGYVPQDLAIYPDLSGRENLMFFARLYGMPTAEARHRSDEVLALTGLADRAGDQTKQYSGGMKRRLNVGVGLLHRPKLLILDEPTVGVDPQSRNAILESVEGLSGAGMAVLYTTHYMEEAERLCDRIGIIDHGKLIAEGTRAELVSMVGEGDRVRLSATGDLTGAAAKLSARSWVRQAKALDGGIDLVVENARSELPAILTDAAADGVAVRSVEVTEPDLEAVFLHLTGRALRD